MAMLEIDGVGKVEVDDGFLSLPPDRQAAEVDQIASMLRGGQPAMSSMTAETAAPGSEEADFLAAANASQPQPDSLAMRGSLLPIGRTKEGEATLALPEFLEGPRKTIVDLLDGRRTAQQLTGREIFDLGALFAGAAPKVAPATTAERAAAAAAPDAPTAAAAVPESPPVTAATPKEEIRTAAKSFYRKAEEANVLLDPKSLRPMVDDMFSTVANEGIDQTLHPRSMAALKRVQELADQPLAFQTFEVLRRVVKAAGKSPDADERRIAGIMVDKIDDYVTRLGEKDVLAGDSKVASETITKARDLWSKVAKLDTVDDLVERAVSSAPNFSASGLENALRTEFRTLSKNAAKMRTFTKQEQAAIKKVARGTIGGNIARNVGRFSPTGPVSATLGVGAPTALATTIGGPVAGVIVGGGAAATSFAARRLATIMTQRRIKDLEDLIKTGSDSEMARAALDRSNELLRSLTGSAAAVGASQSISE